VNAIARPTYPLAFQIVLALILVACALTKEPVSAQSERPASFRNLDNPELDAIGDVLPENAVMRLGTLRLQHPSSVNSMRISPDERTVVTLDSGNLIAWDVETGAESYTSAIDCSPDGRLLAAGAPIGSKNWIYVLHADTGEQEAILKADMWKPWAVQFSVDSRLLYSTGWDGAIRRWDVARAEELPLPKGLRASSSVALAPSADLLAFQDGGGLVRVVNATSGTEVAQVQPEKSIASVLQFSPDNRILYTAGGRDEHVAVEAWDWQTQERLDSFQWPRGQDPHADVEALATTPDGRYLAAAVFRQHKAYIFDTENDEQVVQLPHRSIYGLDISPNGIWLATVGWDRMLRIWEIPSGNSLCEINVAAVFGEAAEQGDRRMYGVRFSPDQRHLAIAHLDGVVSCWDISDIRLPKFKNEFSIGSRFLYGAFDYSPTGTWLACGDAAGKVVLFDAYTGDRMLHAGSHEDHIYTVGFGSDDRWLVSGGGNVCYLWDTHSTAAVTSAADEENSARWRELGAEPTAAFHAIVGFATHDPALDYLMKRVEGIRSVLDPASVTRGRNEQQAARRLELVQQAVDADESVEMRIVVHRALLALRQSQHNVASSFLHWCAQEHPCEAVRSLAVPLLPLLPELH
jgi:WD40 repeat protein